jgi:hypothetical protein
VVPFGVETLFDASEGLFVAPALSSMSIGYVFGEIHQEKAPSGRVIPHFRPKAHVSGAAGLPDTGNLNSL